MWIYKGAEMGLEGIVGVPNRDMTDEEFIEASAKIAFQFGDPKALANCGLWIHEDDTPPSTHISRVRASSSPQIEEEKETPKEEEVND